MEEKFGLLQDQVDQITREDDDTTESIDNETSMTQNHQRNYQRNQHNKSPEHLLQTNITKTQGRTNNVKNGQI